jgi:SAM-dependent methyltransferase
MDGSQVFSSSHYWDARYRGGGASGAGSLGRLARFKAGVINRFVQDNAIDSLIDLGCGDGSQLALLEPPENYIGVDVSPTALARCAARFPNRRFVPYEQSGSLPLADLTLSLDVIYHLVEDAVFVAMMQRLFALAKRFVLIYASNADVAWPVPHVRHREFTKHVGATEPDWRLLAHLLNPCPYDPARPNDTSFADFFVYGRPGAACTMHVPGAD